MSIRITTMIWENGPTDRTDLLVLLALADFANDSGECWPSIATIAKKARLTERGAQKVIARLSAAGWVSVDVKAGKRGCNLYHVRTVGAEQQGANIECDRCESAAETPNPVHPEPRSPRTGVQDTPNRGSPEPSGTVKESSKPEDLETEFEEFWQACPRKVSKVSAKKAYISARKKEDARTILIGMERHAVEVCERDPKFIPYPTTWLNNERWTDDGPNFAKQNKRPGVEGSNSPSRSQLDVIAERSGISASGSQKAVE